MHLALRCLLIVATGHSLFGWGWPCLTATAHGQEQPRRVGRGEIHLSISIRQTTSKQPRFVVAFRVVEEEEVPPPAFQTPPEIVNHFKTTAESAIKDIDRLCQISDAQKSKLKLAAMGDMSRVAREAREVHQKYDGISPRDQAQMLAVAEELALLNASLKEGVFRSESMFSRVLATSLSQEQTTQLVLAQFSQQLDRWSLKLTDQQRDELLDAMFARSQRLVEPILWLEPEHCLALLKSVPAAELEKILEPWQLQTIDGLHEGPWQLSFRNESEN